MMVISDINSTEQKVLIYLKKMKLQNKSCYDRLILFGVKPNDIIKYIERPEDCGKWPFDFVYQVQNAVTKISKNYLMDFPEIEIQTEEDRVLSKLLTKNNFYPFGTNTFFKNDITVHHVTAFMERNEVIYEWNGDFILRIQQEVNRVKAFLL
jgi:hypothetical protein